MFVCTKYKYAFYESDELLTHEKALLEMNPTEPPFKKAKTDLYNHHCFQDLDFVVEQSEISKKMDPVQRKCIEDEFHEYLNWTGSMHVHRNQLLADARENYKQNHVDLWNV